MAALFLVARAPAAEPLTDEQILKKITYPPEFNATVFAAPPHIAYPVFLSAAPDGTLFVSCDENGSLDREPGRGRVVMCRDTDGDGRADVFTTFAKVDSPRGVAWDQSTRTLYVMHPPTLTAYRDTNGDGVADAQEDLITGLGFGLDFRGADHTTNGIRLAIDGWIYIAVGDYGAAKATGRDGATLALRGGGIVRVRPDGTGMELIVRGTRNILAVAISPTLDLFSRDNTNDGDDWNDRLSYHPLGAEMGYPSLFRNFADEIIPPMIDFSGGSPVGSIFIDEPSLPKAWAHGFYSVEWGRSEIDLHPLTAAGAGWKAETKPFIKMTRATDLEVDGAGRLYAASWEGGQFRYTGPNVGYIIQLAPKSGRPSVPDFKKLTDAQLVELVGSDSGVARLAAQRELLGRGSSVVVLDGLKNIIEANPNIGARVAAIFSLKLLQGSAAHPTLAACLSRDDLREYLLKALADNPTAEVSAQPFLAALTDANPRVRLQAVTGLSRLGKTEAAPALLQRTADSDPTVGHVAVAALRSLRAADACLRALDWNDATLQRGALRVLATLHEPAVVDGLLQRLDKTSGPLRRDILTTLARVNHREAPFTDPKTWWGTRPDTSGPLYKPERWAESDRIEAVLKRELERAQGEEAKALGIALFRLKVNWPGLTEQLMGKIGQDVATRLEILGSMISPRSPAPEPVVTSLQAIALDAGLKPELRAQALRLLTGVVEKNTAAVAPAFLPLASDAAHPAPLAAAWEEFTRDDGLGRTTQYFGTLARDGDPAKRALGAAVLVSVVSNPILKDNAKANARRAVDRLWENPEHAASLLRAIGRTRAAGFDAQVRQRLTSDNAALVEAARYAAARLGLDQAGAGSGKKIGELGYDAVAAAVAGAKGDVSRGQQVYLQQACFLCHTVSATEPPKGPMLGGITQRYSRAELLESILKPDAKIAQGFESQYFKLQGGEEIEGFVVREGGDNLSVRNIAGVTTEIEKGAIAKREKREKSIMPEGLMNSLSPDDLASLLAYLESTAK